METVIKMDENFQGGSAYLALASSIWKLRGRWVANGKGD